MDRFSLIKYFNSLNSLNSLNSQNYNQASRIIRFPMTLRAASRRKRGQMPPHRRDNFPLVEKVKKRLDKISDLW